jgi:hypothetical protein
MTFPSKPIKGPVEKLKALNAMIARLEETVPGEERRLQSRRARLHNLIVMATDVEGQL